MLKLINKNDVQDPLITQDYENVEAEIANSGATPHIILFQLSTSGKEHPQLTVDYSRTSS